MSATVLDGLSSCVTPLLSWILKIQLMIVKTSLFRGSYRLVVCE